MSGGVSVAGGAGGASGARGGANSSRTPAASFWCVQALIDGTIRSGVRVEADAAGYVTAVHTEAEARDGDQVLPGVSFPAASNAHSHAFHRILRGRTHAAGPGSFWTWREQMFAAAAVLTPELYEEVAAAVFTEMVVAGWTSVAEFHYLHHRPDGTPYVREHAMELALARAAVAAGIRLTLLDTCYLAVTLTDVMNAFDR